MIVTVTPNPALDRTVPVPALVRGAVLRAGAALVEPSGKGLNVSLALARQGRPTTAVLPAGGPGGDALRALLALEPVRCAVVPVAGDVRTNTSLVEADGAVTKVNEPGPELSGAEVAALLGAVDDALAGSSGGGAGAATWVASCGSLPPGAPDDLHARVVAAARRTGVRVVVDSSGPALLAALAAGPDLVKPNATELAEATGRPLRDLGDVVDAAEELRAAGAAAVLVSLGGDGAVLVEATGALHATAPVPRVLSTVGAGDALLAGYLAAAEDADAPSAARLAEGLRWGGAAVQHASTLFDLALAPTPVHHGPPDRTRVLTEPAG